MATPSLRDNRVDYPATIRFRLGLLRTAFSAWRSADSGSRRAFDQFRAAARGWIEDYAFFMALRRRFHDKPWIAWETGLRSRKALALTSARESLGDEIDFECFVQYLLDRQWRALKEYAVKWGVALIGDVPIFVAHDSADTWAHPKLFLLDSKGRSKLQSGYPPDAFSKNGQLWGHAHYDWKRHLATRFAWWVERFRYTLEQFDAVRIDHFLGFHRCWAVPGGDNTAKRGRWLKTPGDRLLTALTQAVGSDRIIAEDLGDVTEQARRLLEKFNLPGMRILQWAFGEGAGARFHQPHNHPKHCVIYPGTHDNDTFMGWFKSARPADRDRFFLYTGSKGREIQWDIIRTAYQSPSNTAIIQMQDVLGLGTNDRMNVPALGKGNWEWRMKPGVLTAGLAKQLRRLAETFERT